MKRILNKILGIIFGCSGYIFIYSLMPVTLETFAIVTLSGMLIVIGSNLFNK